MQSLREEMKKLHDKVDEKVIAVAKRYIVAFQNSGCPGDAATFNWWSDGKEIEGRWEEYYLDGGEDCGVFEFPIEFVWDENALIEHEKSVSEKIERKKKGKEIEHEKKERQQLQELSDKYPDKHRVR